MTEIADRLAALDWQRIALALDETGGAAAGPLLTPEECAGMRAAWDEDRFRSRIDMRRHGFGSGEYRYFAAPLPAVVAELREAAYRHLAPIANCLGRAAGRRVPRAAEPGGHAGALPRGGPAPADAAASVLCGWRLQLPAPGPLRRGGVSAAARRAASEPGRDFTGGEFVLVEQRPRLQSRPTVLSPGLGHGVVFATSRKPRAGARGWTPSTLRHGVSQLTSGARMTLGVIFHDAA